MLAEQTGRKEVGETHTPDWGIEPVPQSHRHLRFTDYVILWSDLGVGLLVLVAGSLLVPGLGLTQAMLAILVGTLVGNLLLASAGVVGSDLGVPTMVGLRPALGLRGSWLPSALNVIQLIGWAAFEILIMAQAANAIIQTLFGWSNYLLWVGAFAIIATYMAVAGPIAVVKKWLEKFGVWAILASTVWLTWYLATNYDLGALFAQPGTGAMSFLGGVDLVIAMPVSWLPLVADYSRFARRTSSAFWGTYLGYFISNVWFYALGAILILALRLQNPFDLIPGIAALAGGWLALLIILTGETDNAFANIYSTAISAQNIFPRLPFRVVAVGIGAVCAVLAAALPLAEYEWFLLLIGSIFVPLFGVLAADYFLLRGRRYNVKELYRTGGAYWYINGVNIAGVAAWLLGVVMYQVASRMLPWLGATLPGFAVALVAYLVLARLQNVTRKA